MKRIILFCALCALGYSCSKPLSPQDRLTVNDKKINEIIAEMTLEEKVEMMHSKTIMSSGGVPRLGIQDIKYADGPFGVREEVGDGFRAKGWSLDSATYFPTGSALAATWSPELAYAYGNGIGVEARLRGKDIMLGPAINIQRLPVGGRTYEYFSEDPVLAAELAVQYTIGMQDAGTAACVKHYALNNQETNRHFLNAAVSERALREIYLKGFELAVKEGDAKSIMTTYGSVNGLWTAGNYDLCTEIIRKEWGYTGFLMTDWWANINERNTAPDKTNIAAMVRAQNDVYMVCADCVQNEDNLEAALADGTLTRGELQRCAVNVCRFVMHTHAMERLLGNAPEVTVLNRPADAEAQNGDVVFYELDAPLTISLDDICTDKGTSYAFALNVHTPHWYRVTLTASSEQSELAQIPVTLFSMGTANGTFTWNGTGGKPVSFSAEIPIFSRFTTLRLYFAQSGLRMHEIRFEMSSQAFDMAHMGEKPES